MGPDWPCDRGGVVETSDGPDEAVDVGDAAATAAEPNADAAYTHACAGGYFDAEKYVGLLSQRRLHGGEFSTVKERFPGLSDAELWSVCEHFYISDFDAVLRVCDDAG